MKGDVYGMILAGGSGTRLWPISRENNPKQLLSLSGGKDSLLQEAFARVAGLVAPERIITVTGHAHEELILGQLRQQAPDYPPENVLAEPVGRDSAAAVFWGALRIHALDPEAVVVLVWSDQLIRDESAFAAALHTGHQAVREGGLAVVGVPADRPMTNLGYIRMGREVSPGVFTAERFVEKPDGPTAAMMVAEGSYLWNPGVFVMKVNTLLDEFRRLAPELTAPFETLGAELPRNDWRDPALMERIYDRIPRQSIDYLVLEKTDKRLLIPAHMGWSDLGTWDELYHQAPRDDRGNAFSGNVTAMNTHNTMVRGSRRLVAVVGVRDLIVVDTDDALLVCDLNSVQDIKTLVNQLKERGAAEVTVSAETIRPWGAYAVLAEGPGYKLKVLQVEPGRKLSLQSHARRAEHWVVVAGRVHLTRDGDVAECSAGDYFHIPIGARHRIDNRGAEPVCIVEVQQGDYLEEDDIVRYEDDFGRA